MRRTRGTAFGKADNVRIVDFRGRVEALCLANRLGNTVGLVNPYREIPAWQAAERIMLVLNQLVAYRVPDLGSLKIAVQRRGRLLTWLEGALFIVGAVVCPSVYFIAYLNGARLPFTSLAVIVSALVALLVPRIHQRATVAAQMSRELSWWSDALHQHDARPRLAVDPTRRRRRVPASAATFAARRKLHDILRRTG